MFDRNMDVSIIIPCRNGEKTLNETLKMACSQEIDANIEVVAIDSGSTDATLKIISSFPAVKVHNIAPEQFGHGRTRNAGANIAKGKIMVFLNQDAVPADNKWLQGLLNACCADPMAAASFSKHIPRKGCHLFMKRDLEKPMLFSTVSAAIKREVWEKIPFDDDITIAEDLDWARKAVKAGYKIIYATDSIVEHSHNYTLPELFRTKYLVGKETARTVYKGRRPFRSIILCFGGMFWKISGDVVYIIRQKISVMDKLKEIVIAKLSRVASFMGKLAGELFG